VQDTRQWAGVTTSETHNALGVLRRSHEELANALEVLRGDVVTACNLLREATNADPAKHRVEHLVSVQAAETTFAKQLEQWFAHACGLLRQIMAQERQNVPDVVQAELKTLQLIMAAHDASIRELLRSRRESPGPAVVRPVFPARTPVKTPPQRHNLSNIAGAVVAPTADLPSGDAGTKPAGVPYNAPLAVAAAGQTVVPTLFASITIPPLPAVTTVRRDDANPPPPGVRAVLRLLHLQAVLPLTSLMC